MRSATSRTGAGSVGMTGLFKGKAGLRAGLKHAIIEQGFFSAGIVSAIVEKGLKKIDPIDNYIGF